MPLVDLLNNLSNFPYYYGGAGNFTQKSIPFGKDQPGGLSSGEPYIQFPLPDNAPGAVLDYYAANRASLDFPMRGGSLQYLGSVALVTKNAEYDYQRIKKFLKSSPKGYTFITKQIGLQLSNPNIEVGQQANLSPGSSNARFYGLIGSNRIYNGGLNTLTQVRLQGTGVHTDRQGVLPYNPANQSYDRVVASFNQKDGGQTNRLVVLLNNKLLGVNRLRTDFANPGNPSNNAYFNNLESLLRLGIPRSNETILFQYPGGPSSVYGIGMTTIRRYVNSLSPSSVLVKPYLHEIASDPNSKAVSVLDIFRLSKDSLTSNRPGYAYYTEYNRKEESSSQLISYLQASGSVLFQNGNIILPYLYKQAKPGSSTVSQKDIFSLKRDQLAADRPGYFYYTDANKENPDTSQLTKILNVSSSLLFDNDKLAQPYLYSSVDPSSGNISMKDILQLSKDKLQETKPGYFYYTNASKYDETKSRMVQLLETSQSVLDQNGTNTLGSPDNPANNGAKTFNYTLLYNHAKTASLRGKNWSDDAITDFRSAINDAPGGAGAFNNATDYKSQNMQTRLGIAGPGKSDAVTKADVGENYDLKSTNTRADLIKFRFQIMPYNSVEEIPLIFRAYLSSFQDTHNGEFNAFRYVGRGENFYVYNGFTRNITFNFKVAAESKEELKPIYRKLNFLVSQMYPDYNSSGFMRTPLLKLTVGDYIYQQPGFITNMTLSVADNYPWEINLDGDMFEAPKMLDVSCQFTPLHNFLPKRSVNKNDITPLALTPKFLA